MQDDEKKEKNSILANWLPFIKGALGMASVYVLYFLYTISGFSFVQGVEHSGKSNGAFSLAFFYGSENNKFYSTYQLPKKIKEHCDNSLIVKEYAVKKGVDEDKLEKIVVVGARSSAEGIGFSEMDILEKLKDISTKVVEIEKSKFLSKYSGKSVVNGFYHLAPAENNEENSWNLSIPSRCIRFLRFFEDDDSLKSGLDITFDLIYSESVDAFRLNPIYINIENAAAKSLSDFVEIDIKLKLSWVAQSSYEDETYLIKANSSLSLGYLPIGQPIDNLNSEADSVISDKLMRLKLSNVSSWVQAPPVEFDSIEECIKENTECNFVVGDIAFEVYETGDGAKVMQHISDIISVK